MVTALFGGTGDNLSFGSRFSYAAISENLFITFSFGIVDVFGSRQFEALPPAP